MRAQVFWRKVHYWVSIVAAVPTFIILCSGLLLQVKKDFDWIQPRENRGGEGPPRVSFEQLLAICTGLPEAGVRDWADIQRLELRPDRGLVKVTTAGALEVQIDPADGRVLQVAVRRSDFFESLHDGSWFGGGVKRWIFLPAGLLLVVLWATGIYLFLLPQLRRKRTPPMRPAPAQTGN